MACSSSATSPLTTAEACDVPEARANRSPTRACGFCASAVPPGTRRPSTETPGATTSTYTPTEADEGKLLRVGETATDADGGRRMIVACANYFTIEPDSLFRRAAPLEIEIGAGRGDFIIGRAAAMPERNFLAVELCAPLVQLLAARAVL